MEGTENSDDAVAGLSGAMTGDALERLRRLNVNEGAEAEAGELSEVRHDTVLPAYTIQQLETGTTQRRM